MGCSEAPQDADTSSEVLQPSTKVPLEFQLAERHIIPDGLRKGGLEKGSVGGLRSCHMGLGGASIGVFAGGVLLKEHRVMGSRMVG